MKRVLGFNPSNIVNPNNILECKFPSKPNTKKDEHRTGWQHVALD
jgi:hypothetical protein